MTSPAFEHLMGARLRRFDSPAHDVVALTFSGASPDRVLLARLSGSPLGLGLAAARPLGALATATVTRFRHHLLGCVLAAIEVTGKSGLRLRFSRGARELWLDLLGAAKGGNCLLVDAGTQRVLLRWHNQGITSPDRDEFHAPQGRAQVIELGSNIARSVENAAAAPAGGAMTIAIDRRIRSLRRRAQSIEEDIRRAQQAKPMRDDANLLLSHLHRLEGVVGDVELSDINVDPPQSKTLRIAPGNTAQQQAQAWFVRARKLERAARIAQERAALTASEIDQLQAHRRALLDEISEAQLAHIMDDAKRLGVKGLGQEQSAAPAHVARRVAYYEFRSGDNHVLLVGRGAKDNDELTLHVAQPHDLFLHARGVHGAHVIVRLRRVEVCPQEVLLDAATLAAHFSDARKQDRVEVTYALRRHVRKPRGAQAGTVVVSQEKVLLLRLEGDRLERLLASRRTA